MGSEMCIRDRAISKKYQDGQIVNMVSMAGLVTPIGFGGSPYQISKHAAEVFTQELGVELDPFGISVVAVNPSFHNTAIGSNARVSVREKLWQSLSAVTQKEYGKGKEHNKKWDGTCRTMLRRNSRNLSLDVTRILRLVLQPY